MNKFTSALLSLILATSSGLAFAMDDMSMEKAPMKKDSMEKSAMNKDTMAKDKMNKKKSMKKVIKKSHEERYKEKLWRPAQPQTLPQM